MTSPISETASEPFFHAESHSTPSTRRSCCHGPRVVEGQISRLKMLKRTMYGRAGFELLHVRVLNAT